jgi:two-component system alkaline phosphatase synthesis response regulator PhoP/two-component system response regulator VicR
MVAKILVVEDDQDSREVLSRIIENLGYEVLAFASGKEALAEVAKTTIDLAMIDIMMPEMNGYEVLQAIRAMPNYGDIPIIMVTAKDQDTEVFEGYKYGADYYIPKPYTAKQIEWGIKTFLD